MTQTAVEWLIDEIEKHYIINNGILDPTVVMELKRQAKEMEKEQIIDSFVECWKENMPEGYECKQSAEYYYNETYKKD
jgi:hypothetical protein